MLAAPRTPLPFRSSVRKARVPRDIAEYENPAVGIAGAVRPARGLEAASVFLLAPG
jgi:hypothetical protein